MTCCACARCLRSSSAAGHATLRPRGSGFLWRLGGLSYTYTRSATPVCMCPTSSVRLGALLTQPIQTLPLCACAEAAEAWACMCACPAPVCSPGYLWRRGAGFLFTPFQSAPPVCMCERSSGLGSECVYVWSLCVCCFFLGRSQKPASCGFPSRVEVGRRVSHVRFPDQPDCVYSCIQLPQRLQSSSVFGVCCTFRSRVVKECNACGGPGLVPVQAPAPSTPTCTSFAVCSV